MNGREVEDNAGVGGWKPPFPAPSPWPPPTLTNFSLLLIIFSISCVVGLMMTLPILSFLFSFIRQKVWINLNPRQGTAMFRNSPRKGEDRKGEKRELLRNMKAGCYGESHWKADTGLGRTRTCPLSCRVTGFTGKCPLHTTVCKQALTLFPSTPGKQAALAWPSCCTVHRHSREHGTQHGQKWSSPVGCWIQNETQCSFCAQAMGSSGVWGQGLLFPLQAWLGMGGIPLNAPFAAGRHTNATGRCTNATGRCLPSGNGFLGQAGPTCARVMQGLAGPPETPLLLPLLPFPTHPPVVQAGTFLAGNRWHL